MHQLGILRSPGLRCSCRWYQRRIKNIKIYSEINIFRQLFNCFPVEAFISIEFMGEEHPVMLKVWQFIPGHAPDSNLNYWCMISRPRHCTCMIQRRILVFRPEIGMCIELENCQILVKPGICPESSNRYSMIAPYNYREFT